MRKQNHEPWLFVVVVSVEQRKMIAGARESRRDDIMRDIDKVAMSYWYVDRHSRIRPIQIVEMIGPVDL